MNSLEKILFIGSGDEDILLYRIQDNHLDENYLTFKRNNFLKIESFIRLNNSIYFVTSNGFIEQINILNKKQLK